MHGSIRDRLEDLLTADVSAVRPDRNCTRELLEHLSLCHECATEFQAMKQQADLLRSLTVEEEVEPVVGFYARVLQRIEERAKGSIWAIFIDSPFGKRLVFASLALAMLLSTYVVAEESRDGHLGGNPIIAQETHNDPDEPVMGSRSQQRDAVLVNFASYEEPRQ
ncbi:MAG TPA: hypothetical protein VH325_17585 [Bryobacteraceae bacterium]|nr:hypothetical protein [Bryobacteraceae bacterium]